MTKTTMHISITQNNVGTHHEKKKMYRYFNTKFIQTS